MKRVLTAIILIPMVLLVVLRAPVPVMAALVAGVALLATREFLDITRHYGMEPFRLPTYIFVVLPFLAIALEGVPKPMMSTAMMMYAVGLAAVFAPFVFLVIGIRFGIFTPSEVGAFAVAYAIVIGTLAYRELDWRRFQEALRHSVADIGMIMLIIMFSAMIGYVIALERVPQNAAEAIVAFTQNRYVLLTMLIVFILLLGMVLESTVITLLLTPILVPIVIKAGIDPVHFGLIMMSATTLGSMTPPVGVAMYTVCGLLDTSMDEYTREALPLIFAVIALIFAMAFWPPLVMFLPNLVMP